MTDVDTIRFRPGVLAGPISHRTDLDEGSASLTAKRDLQRYYLVLESAVGRVAECIAEGADTDEEIAGRCSLIVAASSGPPLPGEITSPVWMQVYDDIKLNDAHEHHGLDRDDAEALALRLRDAPLLEQVCLQDMVERWWLRADDGVETVSLHMLVGLGRWSDMTSAAGIPANKDFVRGPAGGWTTERIVVAAQRWTDEHGRPPTTSDWATATGDHPSTGTVYNKLGSWGAMLDAAGLRRP